MLVYAATSRYAACCLVVRCAAPCGARATRWDGALRCGSTEQQACPLRMLRIAVSGLPSSKTNFCLSIAQHLVMPSDEFLHAVDTAMLHDKVARGGLHQYREVAPRDHR